MSALKAMNDILEMKIKSLERNIDLLENIIEDQNLMIEHTQEKLDTMRKVYELMKLSLQEGCDAARESQD